MNEVPDVSTPTARLSGSDTFKTLGLLVAAGLFMALTFHSAKNGKSITLPLVGTGIFFSLYTYLTMQNKKKIAMQGGDSISARMKTMLIIEHMAGLESMDLSKAASVMIIPEGLLFTTSKTQKNLIEWDSIESVEAGSDEQLRSRVTLSRFLVTGIFALALKKERKKRFYLTILTTDGLGLWAVNTIGRDNRAMERKAITFTAACQSEIRANPNLSKSTDGASEIQPDVFVQIEKLDSLRKKGLLTQEEFDEKRTELIGRI